MERFFSQYALTYLAVCFFVSMADLYTKHLAEQFIEGEVQILPFLKLVMVHNKGVAFGVFSQAPDWLRLPILLLFPPVAVLITFAYSIKQKDPVVSLCMGAIGGGAIGNLYDRLFLGQVRDFIYLSYGKFSYPAFNLADASISVAMAVFLFYEFFKKRKA
jgi:signal peptidase II